MRIPMIMIAAVTLLASGAVTAQQAEGGESAKAAPHGPDWVQQKTQTCAGCHGPKGVSQTPNFPVLAGQYQDYLVHALTAYRDGQRKNPIMGGQAKGLTDAQIKALAAYFSRQQSPLHTPSLGE